MVIETALARFRKQTYEPVMAKSRDNVAVPKFEMQIDTEYPLLFISDASPTAIMPEVNGETFAAASAQSVAFYVLPYVDGASRITVTDKVCELDGEEMFSGLIQAPTGILSVSDSNDFRYLNIPVPAGEVSIRIWADRTSLPEWVWIRLGTIRSV